MASVNKEGRAKHLLLRTVRTESGCMEFLGCIQANGYARATVNRKSDYAHRHIYRLLKGDIDDRLDVRHSCDNRKCINPDHLILGTRRENMQDAVSRGRQATGFRLPQTKISPEQKLSITQMAKDGILYSKIADDFGICRQMAGRIALINGVRRHGISK